MPGEPNNWESEEDCAYINFQNNGFNDLSCTRDRDVDIEGNYADTFGLCEIKLHTNCIVKNSVLNFN